MQKLLSYGKIKHFGNKIQLKNSYYLKLKQSLNKLIKYLKKKLYNLNCYIKFSFIKGQIKLREILKAHGHAASRKKLGSKKLVTTQKQKEELIEHLIFKHYLIE